MSLWQQYRGERSRWKGSWSFQCQVVPSSGVAFEWPLVRLKWVRFDPKTLSKLSKQEPNNEIDRTKQKIWVRKFKSRRNFCLNGKNEHFWVSDWKRTCGYLIELVEQHLTRLRARRLLRSSGWCWPRFKSRQCLVNQDNSSFGEGYPCHKRFNQS